MSILQKPRYLRRFPSVRVQVLRPFQLSDYTPLAGPDPRCAGQAHQQHERVTLMLLGFSEGMVTVRLKTCARMAYPRGDRGHRAGAAGALDCGLYFSRQTTLGDRNHRASPLHGSDVYLARSSSGIVHCRSQSSSASILSGRSLIHMQPEGEQKGIQLRSLLYKRKEKRRENGTVCAPERQTGARERQSFRT